MLERRQERGVRLRLRAGGEQAPERHLALNLTEHVGVHLGSELAGVHNWTVDVLAPLGKVEILKHAAEEPVYVRGGLRVLILPQSPQHVAYVARIEHHRLAVMAGDVEQHPHGGDAGTDRKLLRADHLDRKLFGDAVEMLGKDVLLHEVQHDGRVDVERMVREPRVRFGEQEKDRDVLPLLAEHGERVAVLAVRLPAEREPHLEERHLHDGLHRLAQLLAGLRQRAPGVIDPEQRAKQRDQGNRPQHHARRVHRRHENGLLTVLLHDFLPVDELYYQRGE